MLPTLVRLKRIVFKREKNKRDKVLGKRRSSSGRPFQIEGPTTEKARLDSLQQVVLKLFDDNHLSKVLFENFLWYLIRRYYKKNHDDTHGVVVSVLYRPRKFTINWKQETQQCVYCVHNKHCALFCNYSVAYPGNKNNFIQKFILYP